MLMLVLADLNRRAADGSVIVKAALDDARRAVHISHGCVLAADSNVKAERLGDMLANEGRLDPILIEPVANEARRRGTLLGDQLIADGLLTPSDLASALERQSRLRFQSALAMSGTVSIAPKFAGQAIVKLPLGAAVAAAFRERIGVEPIKALIAERMPQPLALDLENEAFKRLELGPSELRICRSLAAGDKLEEVLAASNSPDAVVRLIGVLVALGLWA